MTVDKDDRRRPTRRKWKRAVTQNQELISALPVFFILASNFATGPPEYKLAPLHPRHVPSIEPTYHIASFQSKFLYLSYLDPVTGLCLKGADDFYVVVFWILVWTLARALVMRWVWQPVARRLGVKQQDQIQRFAEQGWGLIYAVVSWFVGMTILVTSPYSGPFYLGPSDNLFRGYPHFALTPLTKFYYLVQIAFWTQTMIALNLEKRRKDYWQMFAHHIITFLLLTTSYSSNFTRIGNLILCQMDVVDMFLPIAKMLKYIGCDTAADVWFGIFLVGWVVTRHIFYPWTVWAAIFGFPRLAPYKFSPEQGYFLNFFTHVGFVVLLVGLQVILCLWLYLIVKVVQKVLRGENADDVRSDSELSDDEGDQIEDMSWDDEDDSSANKQHHQKTSSRQAQLEGIKKEGQQANGSLRHRFPLTADAD